jgi:hypothetical protein
MKTVTFRELWRILAFEAGASLAGVIFGLWTIETAVAAAYFPSVFIVVVWLIKL